MSQSSTDHEALKEIARLIAEKDGDGGDGAADDPPRAQAADTGEPSQQIAAALDASLLGKLFDSIPAAVAIVGGGKLIRANESFAMAFGFASAAELREAGGLARVFPELDGVLPEGGEADGNGGASDKSRANQTLTLEARTKSDRKIDVPAQFHQATAELGLLILHPMADRPEPAASPDDTAADRAEPPQGPSRAATPLPEDAALQPPALATDATDTIDLLAKVSHEVRTPLNSIIGFAEMMKQEQFGPLGSAKYLGYAEDIVESGNYALGIINDLLDLSKIRSGNFELNFTAVDVNEVIEDCVHLIEAQARHDRVVLRVSLEDETPRVLADRRSLKQILLNLLSNAVKFTKAGGQVIVSAAGEKNGDVLIRVRDTGVGMSKQDIKQALKPFQQLDTAPRQQVGTGLGLPLTKALAEANRAHMRIESARRVGTSIDIRFPADRVLTD